MLLKNLTKEDVQCVCEKYIKSKCSELSPITIVSYDCKTASELPIGFLASHYLLDVRVKSEKNRIYKNLRFFIKTLPHHVGQHTKYIESFQAFQKETNLYELFIPAAVSVSSIKWVADCYLTKSQEILVFEHLDNSGYRMSSCTGGRLDLDHLSVAMKALAVMHASWMVLEHRGDQTTQKMYAKGLYENAYPSTDGMPLRIAWVKNTINTLQELVKYIPKYSKRHEEIVPEFAKQLQRMFEFCKPSKHYRNVFNHGDLWSNNIMYRYDENENTPIQALFVDFQLSRLAPPALDFMTLLTMVTDSTNRSEYFQKSFNAYYDQLEKELNTHNLNIRNELSFNEFMESCKHYKLAGLIESCFFQHLTLLQGDLSKHILNDSDNFEKFAFISRIEICLQAFRTDENYRHRISDYIEEIIDNFVLKQ